ncbi:MAG: hypothetical protein D3910_10615 [Candidatus Electrothrix sp. ATG2]|nr:hypothetical protein [Candidatus Electrothrix sp. ATG2]
MKNTIIIAFLLSLFSATTVFAGDACLHGTAKWRGGSKIDGSSRISTSWNDKEAYPKNGNYRLCMGSNPKQKITIYLNGKKYTEMYIDGDTRLDIVRD